MMKRRISFAQWVAEGGLRNPRLYRTQGKDGRWRYYREDA